MWSSETIYISCETLSGDTSDGFDRFTYSQRSKTSYFVSFIVKARDIKVDGSSIFDWLVLECFSLTESAIWSAPIWYPEQMQSPSASDLAKYFSLTQTQKLLRYGNYYTQLKPFLKVFKEDEIIFYNGNRLGKIQLRFWRPYNKGKSSIGNMKSGLETKKIHWKQCFQIGNNLWDWKNGITQKVNGHDWKYIFGMKVCDRLKYSFLRY